MLVSFFFLLDDKILEGGPNTDQNLVFYQYWNKLLLILWLETTQTYQLMLQEGRSLQRVSLG